jgi:hypothetical protein
MRPLAGKITTSTSYPRWFPLHLPERYRQSYSPLVLSFGTIEESRTILVSATVIPWTNIASKDIDMHKML